MDRFDGMRIFLTTIQHGSFSAAAREMHVPVQTVSRKLAELERHLGAQLLTRTTRKLSLTEAGIAYAAAARRILEQVDEAEREVAGEFVAPRGNLVVTAPLFFGRRHVVPIVADFLGRFPDIDIRLALGDRQVDLLDDQVDMAVRIGHLPDSGMIATRVGSIRGVVCGSPRLWDGRGVPRTPDDVARFPCIMPDGPPQAACWRFRDPDSAALIEVPVRPRLISTAEASMEAAVHGAGLVHLLHYQAEAAIRAKTLEIVLADYELEPYPVHLVHAPHALLPLKMRCFLDFAAPRLRQAISLIGA
ncbi:transcriptional regulator, LysR family [Caenispirillum bisanense]|uniref:Transcriptional regulator, LysR family n=2 Tax=Caenispirillum bisanense TaxID=414052 RepID=A0A286G8W6_9PROT|nr:transcriptional regulator, LysR family [Caenispirillum bisanense]